MTVCTKYRNNLSDNSALVCCSSYFFSYMSFGLICVNCTQLHIIDMKCDPFVSAHSLLSQVKATASFSLFTKIDGNFINVQTYINRTMTLSPWSNGLLFIHKCTIALTLSLSLYVCVCHMFRYTINRPDSPFLLLAFFGFCRPTQYTWNFAEILHQKHQPRWIEYAI